ncbi:hypothetical protein FRX31_029354 [Thalictrum thalictroides]|uniref:Uncharacterized protein n=1 Tax=Thalictrum thalictroides TaxID=46969 RepID=A0A7J6V7G8_THATH|nr:hypothetical protein FRX31_029354 [Thalictrum thalictroides]
MAVARAWKIQTKLKRAPRLRERKWFFPDEGMVKGNVDGATKGNPGKARVGCIFRNHTSDILLLLSKGVGVSTIFFAECEVVFDKYGRGSGQMMDKDMGGIKFQGSCSLFCICQVTMAITR